MTSYEMVVDIPPEAPSFTRFKDLPVKLRLQIWELALPDPRILQLEVYHDHIDDLTANFAPLRPSLVREEHHLTCRESYNVFADHYLRLKVDPHYNGTKSISMPFPMFIDCRRDTMMLDIDDSVDSVATRDKLQAFLTAVGMPRIRNLALHFWLLTNMDFKYYRTQFPEMRNLSVMVGWPLSNIGVQASNQTDGYYQLIEPDTSLRHVELHVCRHNQVYDYLKNMMGCSICWKAAFRGPRWIKGHAFSMEDWLLDYVKRAKTLRSEYEDQRAKDTDHFRFLNFSTVFLAFYENTNRHPQEVEVWVAPKYRSTLGSRQIYRTKRPVPPSDDGLMWLGDIVCYASCRRNGTFDCPYDGIKELFHEGSTGVRYRENAAVKQNKYLWEMYKSVGEDMLASG